jgi:hypothetical protein
MREALGPFELLCDSDPNTGIPTVTWRIRDAIAHFSRHPVTVPMTRKEAGGLSHLWHTRRTGSC